MNPPTRHQDLVARCAALLRKSALLRRAGSLLVVRSRRERGDAKGIVGEAGKLPEPPDLPGPE